MTCSARLPVYILFISAFFQKDQGLILLSLYFLGALLAILSAIFLKKTLFKSIDVPFVMELPPYRIPTARSIVKHVVYRTGLYLRKIGGVILVASIIVWFFSNFPRDVKYSRDYDSEILKTEQYYEDLKENQVQDPVVIDNQKEEALAQLSLAKRSEQQTKSIMGAIGHALEPVMRPLGFDWRLTVSILTGFAAKEVVVSTLGVLFLSETGDSNVNLVEKIRGQEDESGNKMFTPLIAFSFMLFILTYFPCIAVVAAIRRESGGWKWAIFVVLYTTTIAWLLSFSVYQIGSLFIS